jgi:xanthine dehydrogenase/oxidase
MRMLNEPPSSRRLLPVAHCPLILFLQRYIDISAVPDINVLQFSQDRLLVGAAVRIAALIDALEANSSSAPSFKILARHLGLIANKPVRNMGSWAGNMMLANLNDNFPSDIVTIMAAAGALLMVGGVSDPAEQLSIPEFLQTDMKGRVIISITIPCTAVFFSFFF